MLNATDLSSGTTAFLLLAVAGCLSLMVTRSHRSGLHRQCIQFLCAIAIRFLLSISIYGTELHTVVVGDGDDSGWEGGLGVIADWEYQGLGLLDLPTALLGTFQGQHRGYFYVLAVYFSVLPMPSQLSAAALSCFCGALTAVFAYRLACSLVLDWVAWRVGWWTCFFPVMIIWSCQTIKEPFVILLEVMALYGCVRLRISRFAGTTDISLPFLQCVCGRHGLHAVLCGVHHGPGDLDHPCRAEIPQTRVLDRGGGRRGGPRHPHTYVGWGSR